MKTVKKFFPYLKAVVAAFVPTVLLAYSLANDWTITATERRDILASAVGALLVLLVPNFGYKAPGSKPAAGPTQGKLFDQGS